jgi:hypothetical protein
MVVVKVKAPEEDIQLLLGVSLLKGYKTRKKNKKSNALIVKRRND